jgi:uncharacterized protein (TIGR02270 family)
MDGSDAILWDLYEEHLDEAAFYWEQWEIALGAANLTLAELASGPEQRLAAHLDALIVGGRPVAEKLLIPALTEADEGEQRCAAAWALLHAEHADAAKIVLDALRNEAEEANVLAIGRALELSRRDDLGPRLESLFAKGTPAQRAVLLDFWSTRTSDSTEQARRTEAALSSNEPLLLRAALRALRLAPQPALLPQIEAAFASNDAGVWASALEAALAAGSRAVWEQARRARPPNSRLALSLLALGGTDDDLMLVLHALADATSREDAAFALGFSGRRLAAEHCLALIGDESVAAIAADSFSLITGLTIDGEFERAPPHDPEETLDDDDAPPPEVRPEDDLPLPEADRIGAWWQAEHGRFEPSTRYLNGVAASGAALHSTLLHCALWRRHLFALELSARDPTSLDVRAWSSRQRAALQSSAIQTRQGPLPRLAG